MHHLTTLNLPTPPAREDARRSLLAQVGAFLANGGQIERVPHTERAPIVPTSWNTNISRNKRARREYQQQRLELAEHIADLALVQTDLGPIHRTPYEIYQVLKAQGIRLNTVIVEQIAAQYGIELRDDGRCRA
ncbi:hypothetical protein [Stutzerimonas nitrititolerans]|uniref:hypothetical protein n=1 Tax=Stutzerimonas nitrititolerans TaxID=2482751 RepID=UPI0028AE5F4F|nr:hypothetical protein [Stutzerimonas nitrititolerans]